MLVRSSKHLFSLQQPCRPRGRFTMTRQGTPMNRTPVELHKKRQLHTSCCEGVHLSGETLSGIAGVHDQIEQQASIHGLDVCHTNLPHSQKDSSHTRQFSLHVRHEICVSEPSLSFSLGRAAREILVKGNKPRLRRVITRVRMYYMH